MINRQFLLKYIFPCLIICSNSASADTITWTAQNPNNDINDPTNWSPNAIPGSSDDVIFDSGISGIDTNPTENSAPFSISIFNFPSNASIFNFNFNNNSLTFNGNGVTGANTNPTITVTNTNNSSFPGDLVSFVGGTGTSGSSFITSSTSGTITGAESGTSIGPINSNFHSTGPFTIASGGNITASIIGNDSTTGTGNNGTANTGASQLKFDESFTAGDNVNVSISNSGTFSGTNTVQGDAVAIVNGSHFISSGAFQVGNNFNCQMQNTGNDSSLGVGLSNIGQLNSAQMILQTTGTIGNNCTIAISNTGINSSQTTNYADFIGYLNDQQFFVGNTFQAGDNFTLTVSNTGTDTSNGYGTYQVAMINSNSGTTGNQILFQQGGTLGDYATISATNSGTYSGSNTHGGSNVAGLNLQQIAIGESTMPGSYSFATGDYFNLSASNSGIDSSNGLGGNAVGDISEDQITLFTPTTLGNYANLTIANNGNFSGDASSTYVNVGSSGGCQLNCVSSFSVGDNFTLNASNSGTNSGSGVGDFFIGDLITGQQITFQDSFIIGNNASITLSNSGSNSSTTTSNNQVGSFMGYGKQLLAEGLFQTGDDFVLRITNSGFDDSTGPGGNFVAFINNNTVDNTGSQIHLTNGATLGDRASITVSNTGSYQGTNTTTGNLIATLSGQQFYSVTDFTAGNNFALAVSNSGTDNASGQNNNSIATTNGSQVKFDGACVVGNAASIILSNSGTNNDTTGTLNDIGIINGHQLELNGNFTAGTNLNLSLSNTSINNGNSNNRVGYVAASQITFPETCTFNDGSLISAFNSGDVIGSQIEFTQGFNLISGKATIQAINQGTIGSYGINIQGNSAGGNVVIELGNNMLNIVTTPPTFTVGGLIGDSNSIVQSQPSLIISTDSSTNAIFSGTLQDFMSTNSPLTKTGPGAQTLSGNSTYTGPTTIEQGKLTIIGSIAGDLSLSETGTLGGNVTIGGSVMNAGTLAPGSSIGKITILGNLSNLNGNYDMEVQGKGISDLIEVGGTVYINGGTVFVSSADGTYSFQRPYTILTASTISGKYSDSLPSSPLLFSQLTYDPQHVYLTLYTQIAKAAATRNQLNVANSLDGIIHPNKNQTLILSELVDLPASDTQDGLDSLSGYQHTDDLWTTQLTNRRFIRRLYDPLRPIVANYSSGACRSNIWSEWLETDIGYSKLKGNSEAHGFKMNSYEVTGGVQTFIDSNWLMGIAGSYEYDNLVYTHAGYGKNSTVLIGAYGLFRPCGYYGLADVTYGYSANDINRAIIIGPLDYTAHSKPEIYQGTFYGEMGLDFNASSLLLQPFIGIEVGTSFRKSLKESKAHGWGLSISKKSWTTATSRLGVHLNANKLSGIANVSVDLAWNSLLSSHTNVIPVQFSNFGNSYNIQGVNLDYNSLDYALTLSTEVLNPLRAYVEVEGEYWQHLSTFNVLAGVELTW